MSLVARPYVVYWNNLPAPYMVERFNAVADRAAFDFEVWFNDRVEHGRSWDVDETGWRFIYKYIPTSSFLGRKFHWPIPLLFRRPDVLVSLYAEPSFVVGWALAKMRGVKTGFWVEVTFDHLVNRTPFKERLKRWMFTKVDAVVTVGADGKQYAERYGACSKRIFFAPHSIDVSHYQEGASIELGERKALRKELGLRGVVFIYVGRLLPLKGIDYLIDAFACMQQKSSTEVSLLLVGDGPEEPILKQACVEHNVRNVTFAGFKQKEELPRYYALADVFVFPTLGDTYGLVVDEAMSCSLPIISTDAVGEIHDRVENGVNGFIVPSKSSKALAQCMLDLVRTPSLRKQMGKISAQKIHGHNPEKWAEDFEKIVRKLLSKAS